MEGVLSKKEFLPKEKYDELGARTYWFNYLNGKLATFRISTISTSRLFLYFPFIVSMCGIGNYIGWLLVVAFLAEIKSRSLIAASKAESNQDYIMLIRRSTQKYSFFILLFIEILGGIVDYLFLMIQVKLNAVFYF